MCVCVGKRARSLRQQGTHLGEGIEHPRAEAEGEGRLVVRRDEEGGELHPVGGERALARVHVERQADALRLVDRVIDLRGGGGQGRGCSTHPSPHAPHASPASRTCAAVKNS